MTTNSQRQRQRQPPRRKLRDTPKNRIVDLQVQKQTRDALGGFIVEWASVAKVWAAVEITGVSEEFNNDANRLVARRYAKVRINNVPGLNELWRAVFQNLPWDIEGIAKERGITNGIVLTVQTDVSRTLTPTP